MSIIHCMSSPDVKFCQLWFMSICRWFYVTKSLWHKSVWVYFGSITKKITFHDKNRLSGNPPHFAKDKTNDYISRPQRKNSELQTWIRHMFQCTVLRTAIFNFPYFCILHVFSGILQFLEAYFPFYSFSNNFHNFTFYRLKIILITFWWDSFIQYCRKNDRLGSFYIDKNG